MYFSVYILFAVGTVLAAAIIIGYDTSWHRIRAAAVLTYQVLHDCRSPEVGGVSPLALARGCDKVCSGYWIAISSLTMTTELQCHFSSPLTMG
jgi:hypothetical protein